MRARGSECAQHAGQVATYIYFVFQVHYKTPRSDLHCIFVNVNSWNLFCFECQEVLYIDSFKKLREAVELVKKVAENKHVNKSVMTNKKPVMTKSNR